MSVKNHLYALLARPSLQPLLDRLIGYALRLKGFNNYPQTGGGIDPYGERWFIGHYLGHRAPVCLDVGGNRGEFTLCLLELTHGRVYCIEPNPAMAAEARALLASHADRVSVIEKAISDTKGMATLRVDPEQSETATLSASVNAHAYHGARTIDVEVVTLDDLVQELDLRRLDFIKIDVEGLELACLRGATRTLASLRPEFVQVEFHWHHIFTGTTVFSIAELLPGYRPYRLLHRGLVPVDPKATLDNIFAYSNLLFWRADAARA